MQHEGATRIVMRIGSDRSFPSVSARWKRTQGTREHPIAQDVMYAYWGFFLPRARQEGGVIRTYFCQIVMGKKGSEEWNFAE